MRKEEQRIIAEKLARAKDNDPEYLHGIFSNHDDITVSPSSSDESLAGPCIYAQCKGEHYWMHK